MAELRVGPRLGTWRSWAILLAIAVVVAMLAGVVLAALYVATMRPAELAPPREVGAGAALRGD